jgi:hypothetical protein
VIRIRLATPSFEKISLGCQDNLPADDTPGQSDGLRNFLLLSDGVFFIAKIGVGFVFVLVSTQQSQMI